MANRKARRKARLTNVDSSVLSAIGFDPKTQALTARFKATGAEYVYPQVSAAQFADFLAAPSLGQYFNSHIKPKGGLLVAE